MRIDTDGKKIKEGPGIQTEKFIRVDEIKVRCNIPIGQLEKLSIQERMGTHTIARVTAVY